MPDDVPLAIPPISPPDDILAEELVAGTAAEPPPMLIPPILDEAVDVEGAEEALLITVGTGVDRAVLDGAENFRKANCSN